MRPESGTNLHMLILSQVKYLNKDTIQHVINFNVRSTYTFFYAKLGI